MQCSSQIFSNPERWRGGFFFIEEESQGVLEKPQERVKASQRSLSKKGELFGEARAKGSSFLEKLEKKVHAFSRN